MPHSTNDTGIQELGMPHTAKMTHSNCVHVYISYAQHTARLELVKYSTGGWTGADFYGILG